MNALLKLLPEPTKDQTAQRAINALATLGVERSKITYDAEDFQLWSKDVVTLLPRAQRVIFFDNDQPEKQKMVADVDWRILILHCAPLMKDAGFTPPRYLVETFLMPEQLEAMKAAQGSRATS